MHATERQVLNIKSIDRYQSITLRQNRSFRRHAPRDATIHPHPTDTTIAPLAAPTTVATVAAVSITARVLVIVGTILVRLIFLQAQTDLSRAERTRDEDGGGRGGAYDDGSCCAISI